MKPNVNFLRKVADRKVYATMGYKPKRGAVYGFVGGEKTANAHAKAGYCTMPYGAALGRPAYAESTDKGRAVLEEVEKEQP